MILIPVLILQIFIFPYTAAVIMDAGSTNRQILELQEIAGTLGSSMQQLYFTVNHASVSSGSVKINLNIPTTIENRVYNVTLHHAAHLDGSYQVMNITLCLIGTKTATSTIVTLGDNIDWTENLSFNSTASPISLVATKTTDHITLSFGGA
jgi:hypothetical protein